MLLIEFLGPCSSNPLLKTSFDPAAFSNAGTATVFVLEKNHIPFKGNESGLNSAFNTPVGMDALEVLSDSEMRAYGWCYQVDGKLVEVFPDAYKLDGTQKKISWFYGYAHYKNGEWISQCELSYQLKPEFLCGKP